MEALGVLIFLAVVVGIFGGYLWSMAWAIGDARKRGHSGGRILVLFWLLGPLAPFVWLGSRPSKTVAERLPGDYMNADDALDAASRLDSLGDWDAAVQLYEDAAKRWPENGSYIASCIESIRQKQSLAD